MVSILTVVLSDGGPKLGRSLFNKIPFGPVLELWWWRAGRSRAAAIFGAIMIQLRPGSSSSLAAAACAGYWVAAVIRGDSTNRNTGGHIRRNIQVTTKPGAVTGYS